MPVSRPNPETALADALRLHRENLTELAESAYRKILTHHPDHADALHLLGMLLHQTDRSQQAEKLIRKAIAIDPRQAVFHSNLGVVLTGMERFDAAVESYRLAQSLNPNSPETSNNLGVALHSFGATSTAMECFKRAFLLNPSYVDAQVNLAQLMHMQPGSGGAFHVLADILFEAGRPADAVAWYHKSLSIEPTSAQTHNNLGNALFAAGEQVAAVEHYQQALLILPTFPQAWNNLSNALKELGHIQKAVIAFERAIDLQPHAVEPLSSLGNAYAELRQWGLAMTCYEKAIALSPNHAATLNNIGNLHSEQSQWKLAIKAYQKALALAPNYTDAINNLGTALEEIGSRDDAMACYRRASLLDAKLVSPPWNIALLQLLRGEYEAGWLGYENRWRQKKQSRSWRDFDQPVWIGLPIEKGARILLHAEQGFGDAIQFCRYAPLVAALGVEVMLECPPPLIRLFSTLPGVARIIPCGDPLPKFDLHCPLMSLPKVFGTKVSTIPSAPYLFANDSDIAKWKSRLDAKPASLRVGLVWAGQSSHQKDRHRSLSLAAFAELGELPGVQFYSLQVGEAADQTMSPPQGMTLFDWTADLHDFADTAALISQLDLVISVDTAVCHVAGAIGKPVWILIAFQPDWRWLLDRDDSPWYPSARLFRQSRIDDWSEPMTQIAETLRDLCR